MCCLINADYLRPATLPTAALITLITKQLTKDTMAARCPK